MASICKTVNLYTRPIKQGAQLSFYLDYYPGWRDPVTNKVHRRESIGIFIYAKPKTQREKDFNASMKEKAEAIRCQRYEEIVNERYSFFDQRKLQGSFLEWFKAHADKKNDRYVHAYKHFYEFVDGKCTFAEVTIELCNKFLEHLRSTHQMTHANLKLHPNSVASYWSAFVGTIYQAFRENKITENIAPCLDHTENIPTQKIGLSAEELIRLAETPCEVDVLKRAFLFSCLTGLRKSDIKQLTWEMIQPEADGTLYLTIRMQKTQDIIHNPIGEEALSLMGERKSEGLVFPDFHDKMTQTTLKQWVKAAGITKKITYHSSRHTFCTLQLDAGVDARTVQILVGHKRLETTQGYLDKVDSKKAEAANRITLKRTTDNG